ncbi:hypothetical protein ACRALDRAFT_207978 [Sodiomyces alcalophilus JCM 7366]|uniref:uncharacterized protein n=1 Tax=Sodiomyces alcalophilus JCM 7366 TaxID=591952 RepID=UPI0039B5DB00
MSTVAPELVSIDYAEQLRIYNIGTYLVGTRFRYILGGSRYFFPSNHVRISGAISRTYPTFMDQVEGAVDDIIPPKISDCLFSLYSPLSCSTKIHQGRSSRTIRNSAEMQPAEGLGNLALNAVLQMHVDYPGKGFGHSQTRQTTRRRGVVPSWVEYRLDRFWKPSLTHHARRPRTSPPNPVFGVLNLSLVPCTNDSLGHPPNLGPSPFLRRNNMVTPAKVNATRSPVSHPHSAWGNL